MPYCQLWPQLAAEGPLLRNTDLLFRASGLPSLSPDSWESVASLMKLAKAIRTRRQFELLWDTWFKTIGAKVESTIPVAGILYCSQCSFWTASREYLHESSLPSPDSLKSCQQCFILWDPISSHSHLSRIRRGVLIWRRKTDSSFYELFAISANFGLQRPFIQSHAIRNCKRWRGPIHTPSAGF